MRRAVALRLACGARPAANAVAPDAAVVAPRPDAGAVGPDGPRHPGGDLVIGLGERDGPAMRPIPDDDVVLLAPGKSYAFGYDVFLQVRQRGLAPARVSAWVRLLDPVRGQALRDMRYPAQEMIDVGDGFSYEHGLRVFVCPSEDGQAIHDVDVEARIRLEDAVGWQLEGRARVHPVCPPDDEWCRGKACARAPGR